MVFICGLTLSLWESHFPSVFKKRERPQLSSTRRMVAPVPSPVVSEVPVLQVWRDEIQNYPDRVLSTEPNKRGKELSRAVPRCRHSRAGANGLGRLHPLQEWEDLQPQEQVACGYGGALPRPQERRKDRVQNTCASVSGRENCSGNRPASPSSTCFICYKESQAHSNPAWRR